MRVGRLGVEDVHGEGAPGDLEHGHLDIQGRCTGDAGEMQGRYRRDVREMQARCRGDIDEM